MTISYDPSLDELIMKSGPLSSKPNKVIKGIKLWWNDRWGISGIAIADYTEEVQNFKNCRNKICLGGIWKDIGVTDEDIREIRKDMLKSLEEKW